MSTPNELFAGEGCISCLPENQLSMLRTILLYKISESTMTPEELFTEAGAGCFTCLPNDQQIKLQTILLNKIFDAGSYDPSTADNLFGAGSPEGVVTAKRGQHYLDTTNSVTYWKLTGSGNTGWI